MSGEHSSDLAGDIAGLRTFLTYHWMMIAAIAEVVEKRFGKQGLAAVANGFRAYGDSRGQALRDLPEVIAHGRHPLSLFQFWDTGEIADAALDEAVSATGNRDYVEIVFHRVPGRAYFRDRPERSILESFWHEFLSGLARGFDSEIRIATTRIDFVAETQWKITISRGHTTAPTTPLAIPELTRDKANLIKLSRRTIGTLGGLITNVGRALRKSYDASADGAIGEFSYAFGAMRGGALREQHLSEGKPINFESFFGGLQQRDFEESVFVFRGERHISPGTWQMDCTYCPLAEVWHADGPDGLDIAYVFDQHNHRGLVESYHPQALARWDAVKSRGDKTCKFRFVIPSLISDSDPPWAQKLRRPN